MRCKWGIFGTQNHENSCRDIQHHAQCNKNQDPWNQCLLYLFGNNGVDSNSDGIISQSEAEACLHLDLHDRGITDMSGIETFINLETLDCSFNTLTDLDLSKLTELRSLNCMASHLSYLDVSASTRLTFLECRQNTIQHLYLDNHPLLEELYCNNNYDLEELSLTQCAALRILECPVNDIVDLDISVCTSLEILRCYINDLSNLNVSSNTALRVLHCSSNLIDSLNVSSCSELEVLRCANNTLSKLDISNNHKLESLHIYGIPTLEEVCVWSLPFPPADVQVDSAGSPNVVFTTECS